MVFFDAGDTLIERADDPVAAMLATLGALGVRAGAEELRPALEALAHAYRAGVYAPLWRAMAGACLAHLPPAARRPAVGAGLRRELAGYARHYRPVAGMRELVARLAAAGRPVGVISNWVPSLPRVLAALGFGPFQVLACSGRLGRTKPDPAIFRWALRRAGVPAARAWHIGNDPRSDYAAAAAAGLRPVLWDPRGESAGGALRRVGSAQELEALLLREA